MFLCPDCNANSGVLETRWRERRPHKKARRFTLERIRKCRNGHKFTTHELLKGQR